MITYSDNKDSYQLKNQYKEEMAETSYCMSG